MSSGLLFDPVLYTAAALVDDLERVRIGAGNRVGVLTRSEPDEDGVMRGFGLSEAHPQVAVMLGLGDGLAELEHKAVLALQRAMRGNPLAGWVKSTVGVGEKQAARLLAAIGDPYWNTLHDRPRTVSELWAYCGLHVLPVDHRESDAHGGTVDRDQTSGSQSCRGTHGTTAAGSDFRTDRTLTGTHEGRVGAEQAGDSDLTNLVTRTADASSVGVAAKRQKGQQANWSTWGKTRAYLVAVSCVKQLQSPYRVVYLARREHTAGTHPDWTPGHSHNDALRITAKAILRDLWCAARDIHVAQESAAA